MLKEEFIQLQLDYEKLASLLEAGAEIENAREDLAEMSAKLHSAPWKIDMDGRGQLADRIIANDPPAMAM